MEVRSITFTNVYTNPEKLKEIRESKAPDKKQETDEFIEKFMRRQDFASIDEMEKRMEWGNEHIVIPNVESAIGFITDTTYQYLRYKERIKEFMPPDQQQEALKRWDEIYQRSIQKVADKVTENYYSSFISQDNIQFIKQSIIHVANEKVSLPLESSSTSQNKSLTFDQLTQLDSTIRATHLLRDGYHLKGNGEDLAPWLSEVYLGLGLGTIKAFLHENTKKANLPNFLQQDIFNHFDKMANNAIDVLTKNRHNMLIEISMDPRRKTTESEIDRKKVIKFMNEWFNNYETIPLSSFVFYPSIDIRV